MPAILRPISLLALAPLLACLQAHAEVSINSDQDGLLSVQANNVSAGELATELSDHLGISVVVTGDTETRVNLDIVEEPLERALGKLSPNHMLVMNNDASEITEVVLMMGEGQSNAGGGGPEQFLPSGSPAEEVISDQAPDNAQISDEFAARGRQAAEDASADPNLPAAQLPPMFGEDSQSEIDPATGLPFEQAQ